MDWKKEKLTWVFTGNPLVPLATEHEGKKLELRVNDFPAEEMFTLFVDKVEIESFSEWPDGIWNQPDVPDVP
jgi:hypothetical protein